MEEQQDHHSSKCKEKQFVKGINFSSGNLAAKWKEFKDNFEFYRIVKKYDDMETEEEKIANMLVLLGSDSVRVYKQFKFNETKDDTKRTLDNTIKYFDRYFEPVKNVTFERLQFNRIVQKSGQTIHQFIVELQCQAEKCEYGDMADELVKDRIVVGVQDDKLREYLIDLEELTMAKCILKAKQYTSQHEQALLMTQSVSSLKLDTNPNIDVVQKSRPTGRNTNGKQASGTVSTSQSSWGSGKLSSPCPKCSKTFHRGGRCPAERSKCHECEEIGHWAKSKHCKKKTVHEVGLDQLDGLVLGSNNL